MLGELLQELRKDKGMTQAELAAKLELSPLTVSSYECGRSAPDDETKVKIAEIFDNAAIDHERTNDGQIYVTGHPFNFWVMLDEKRHLLIFWTYWEFVPDLDELEALTFTNALNNDKIMLQFSRSEETNRLYSHYVLPYRDGLIPKLVLRIGQKMSGIFDEAAQAGITDGLLVPLQCGDDLCPAAPTTTH